MITKTPFNMNEVLDEIIYFKFNDGVKSTYWTSDKEPITLKSFIDRNIEDAEIFPQYAELKNTNEKLIEEVLKLREQLRPFEKNKGIGRRKGSFKLSDKQTKEVLVLKIQGLSNIKIAAQFKVSEKTIRNILKRNMISK